LRIQLLIEWTLSLSEVWQPKIIVWHWTNNWAIYKHLWEELNSLHN
jgi:hypothetical protein